MRSLRLREAYLLKRYLEDRLSGSNRPTLFMSGVSENWYAGSCAQPRPLIPWLGLAKILFEEACFGIPNGRIDLRILARYIRPQGVLQVFAVVQHIPDGVGERPRRRCGHDDIHRS